MVDRHVSIYEAKRIASMSVEQRIELLADAFRLYGPHVFISTPFLVQLVQHFVTGPTDTSPHAFTDLLKATNCLRCGVSFILVHRSHQIRVKRAQ